MTKLLVKTNDVAVCFDTPFDYALHEMLKDLYVLENPSAPDPVFGVAITFNIKKEGEETAGIPVGVIFDNSAEGDELDIARQGLMSTFKLLQHLRKLLMAEDAINKIELGDEYEEDIFLKRVCGEYQRCVDILFQLTDEKLGLTNEYILH